MSQNVIVVTENVTECHSSDTTYANNGKVDNENKCLHALMSSTKDKTAVCGSSMLVE